MSCPWAGCRVSFLNRCCFSEKDLSGVGDSVAERIVPKLKSLGTSSKSPQENRAIQCPKFQDQNCPSCPVVCRCVPCQRLMTCTENSVTLGRQPNLQKPNLETSSWPTAHSRGT